jgi:toxin ParE1/3/4
LTTFRLQRAASRRIDEIFRYTEQQWGRDKAEDYVSGLFARFQAIADRKLVWRAIPAEFGVKGWFCRHEKHFIYWKELDDGIVGIVTILHEKMNFETRFRREFIGESE